MKKTRKTFLLISTVMMLGLTLSGCNKQAGGDNVLDIFSTNAGYGIDWIKDMVKGFSNASWVKQKYPNLKINFGNGDYDASSSVGSKITAGTERVNKYDLLFSCNPCGDSFGSNINTSFYEELSDVYNGAIPGEKEYDGSEGKMLKDKMNQDVLSANQTRFPDGKDYYLTFPWIIGSEGIIYNETKLSSYISDFEKPRTTNELNALVERLATLMLADEDYPWVTLNGGDYNDGTLITWWAQYEGVENYNLFFEGKNKEGEYTSDNFKQVGRLRALQALESLYQEDNIHPDSYLGVKKFMTIQNRFIRGIDGIFMFQGDWFENENKESVTNQVFNWMKTPINSTLVEKCDSLSNDEQLSFVIKCIDEGKDYEQSKAAFSYGDLSENDYEYLKNARSVEYMMYGHQAHIPNYASGKEIAKDFLRYMATNEGIEIMIKAGKGYQTAFDYQPDTSFINDNYSILQKSRRNILETATLLKPKSSWFLFNYGGLTPWKTLHPEQVLTATLAKDRKTAQQIYDEEVEYYTKDGSANFKNILKQAGINL